MDIIRLIGVGIVEYPYYLFSSNYDSSRFWNKCIQINTLYTKVLQTFAVQYVSKKFYYHFNDIPYNYDEISPIEYLTPTNIIGSGMISIVLEGVDKKGNTYIIKTKRKGIDAKIKTGLQQIKNILFWLNYIPYMSTFNFNFLYTQFEHMMLAQLSFDQEIRNHKKFKKNVAYNNSIIVPELSEEYCTSSQIVMTKLIGSHYSAISDELGNKYAKQLIEMTSKNLLLDGFIHSDLHAGNIIFCKDDKLGIIDFGLMIELTIKERQIFFDLLKYFAMQNYEQTVSIFVSELVGPTHVKEKLTVKQQQKLHDSLKNILHTIQIVHKTFTFNDIIRIIQCITNYNLTISNLCYQLLIFIVSGESLMKKLSPDYLNIFMDKIKILADFEFEE
jgi:predicted unusual protein kinase regulating ubiquinone biosynthesis (AarF/ABC1/UbiB family)